MKTKKSNLPTEVIGLDGSKQLIEPEKPKKKTTTRKKKDVEEVKEEKKTSTKKTTTSRVRKKKIEEVKTPEPEEVKVPTVEEHTKEEKLPEVKVEVEKVPEDLVDDVPIPRERVVDVDAKITAYGDPTKLDLTKLDPSLANLIDTLSETLINNLSKVFIRVEDAEALVVSTIQKLAIGKISAPEVPEISQ